MYANLRYLVVGFSMIATLSWAENPTKVDAPEVKVGDRWVYNEIDLYKKEKTGVSVQRPHLWRRRITLDC
jgi:hypothetical protein